MGEIFKANKSALLYIDKHENTFTRERDLKGKQDKNMVRIWFLQPSAIVLEVLHKKFWLSKTSKFDKEIGSQKSDL